MIKELATWIQNNTTLIIGVDLFVGERLIEAPVKCIVLLESGGKPDFWDTKVRETTIEILARAQTYLDAKELIWPVYSLLHGLVGQDLPVIDSNYLYSIDTCDALTEPQPLGTDEKGNNEFSVNLVTKYQQY